ncbi:MAG: type II toxin-antitoxin system VapC family toxin [Candidatus Electrothrix aestuarii]|uniref:Type II toxin-antitoxin system VapC family toxin n=1 Tax=Candidatus Electrothrix aestuarii TaxID=3062594 RepID=A0AAU8LT07_9BACT|nr:type II toxin-antitoxin system VapC family toxin [Candidatus Electrothrix aestuarii]
MLLDSNAIIYSVKPEFDTLRRFIAEQNPSVSAISYVEVLGYHQLTEPDKDDFVEFFDTARIVPVTQSVLIQAVALRQQRKMSLGDAIIAATALLNELTLVTANVSDFRWVEDIKLMNPLTEL